jgi:hypothetical protein
MLKAKALKRGGDPSGASQAMEEARTLDLQDRFLNWKAAKYMLRAGRIESALSILGLFTKVSCFTASFLYIDTEVVLSLVRKMHPRQVLIWKKCSA